MGSLTPQASQRTLDLGRALVGSKRAQRVLRCPDHALQIAGLSVELLEIDAASVEPLPVEVACGAGCALVPESVIARLRTPGVSFRRLGGITPVGCNIGAVVRNAEWEPSLSALITGWRGHSASAA